MKKIWIVLAALLGLSVLGAIAIPMFVDVDKYRPQIIQQAEGRLNGKLELGKLSLSLWGQVKIEIAGLKLRDAKGRQVVEVKDAYFHLPLISILSGSPSLILHMSEPELNVLKDKSGKINVLSLVKNESGQNPANPAQTPPQAEPSGKPLSLPGIATRAALGLEISHALVTYDDEASGLRSQVKDLDVKMENLSLTREMSLEISAGLDTRLKAGSSQGGRAHEDGLELIGPAKITGKAKPTLEGGRFERVEVSAHIDLDPVEIKVPGLFRKKPGIASHADIAFTASTRDVTIDHLDLVFFNADIQSSGKLTQLGDGAQPVVAYQLKSNPIQLKSWSELIPMLKDAQLGGTVALSAEAHGPADKLVYQGDIKLVDFTAKAPNLKADPHIDAELAVLPDKADLKASIHAPGNDLSVKGSVLSFTRPQIRLEVASSGLDLDQLIVFPPPAGSAAAGAQSPPAGAAPAAKVPAAVTDRDTLLDPIRTNKSLALADAHLDLNVRSLKAKGVTASDILSKASFVSLVGAIDSFSMKIFGGQVKSSASVDLKPKIPDYRFRASVAGLDLGEALQSQINLFKDTVTGKLGFEMMGSGKSFNTDPAIENLNAKGKMRIDNAVFASIDVGKMAGEAINGAIAKIAGKIPGLKGKTISNELPTGASRYDFLSSGFTIQGGVFDAPDFTTRASPGKGVDLKGDTRIGLKDRSLHANWEVIDTYNLTHARDLSVDEMGIQIPHILAEGNGPVKFPLTVTGTLSAPQYSYAQVAESLVKIALENASDALKGEAKAQVQNRAKDLLKQVPPDLRDKLKGLFGG